MEWSIQTSVIVHGLRVAAERFEEHSKELIAAADGGGSALMTARAARDLAEQFRTQASDSRSMAYLLEGATEVRVELDELFIGEDDERREAFRKFAY